MPPGSQIVAVFIGDEGEPVVDDFNRQLRAELGIDNVSSLAVGATVGADGFTLGCETRPRTGLVDGR